MANVLVLRTCKADLTSHEGFQWPDSGPVSAPDWDSIPECGRGLHGLLWGEGDGSLLNWEEDAKWLVVEVSEETIVEIGLKVKFPAGVVVHCGDRVSATKHLAENGGQGRAIVDGTATAGDSGTATAGEDGVIVISYWDATKRRYRLAVGNIGENGIKPNTMYWVVDGVLREKILSPQEA
jgi:hypothetical protein